MGLGDSDPFAFGFNKDENDVLVLGCGDGDVEPFNNWVFIQDSH